MRSNFANNYIWKDDDVEKKKYSGSGVYASFLTASQFDTLGQADWQDAKNYYDVSKLAHFIYASNLMRGFDFTASGEKKITVEDFVALPVFHKSDSITSIPTDDECKILTGQPWMNPIMKIVKAIFNTKPLDYSTVTEQVYYTNLMASSRVLKPSYSETDYVYGGVIEFSMGCRRDNSNDDVYFNHIKVQFSLYDIQAKDIWTAVYFDDGWITASSNNNAWTSLTLDMRTSHSSVGNSILYSIGSPLYVPVMCNNNGWVWQVGSSPHTEPEALLTALNAEFDPLKFNEEYRYLASVVDLREEDM
jgi:hypothetical protein